MIAEYKYAASKMRLFNPRLSLSALLVAVTICSLTIHIFVSCYHRQVLAARKIEKLGGHVCYGWHNPIVHDHFVVDGPASLSLPQDDGSYAITPPPPDSIPFKLVFTTPPDLHPSWSIFDFSNDWEIQYVALPSGQFDREMIQLLETLPELQIIEVNRNSVDYSHFDDAETSQLRKIRKSFPNVEVIDMWEDFSRQKN